MNYEPLIERELAGIPAAAHAFLRTHSPVELWVSVTRFAVLAYAPSQHSKRAVMACLATHDLREELGDGFGEMLVACARYAAQSRQPWSEPPILEPPEPSTGLLEELATAMREGDRVRAERWLSARFHDAGTVLRDIARGDARLMLDTATRLEPLLGAKSRYALLRMPLWELVTDPEADEDAAPLDTLIARAAGQRGSVEAVREVLVRSLILPPAERAASEPMLVPYDLARDYAQTLIAHAFARRLPTGQRAALLRAVHDNLEHGESYAEWSFA